jgi:hypothetical protein
MGKGVISKSSINPGRHLTKVIMAYKVKFTKWRDPLKRTMRKMGQNRSIIEDEDEKEDFDSEYSGPVASTEFGIFAINEETCLSTYFNFWEGNTNFPLENYHKFLIDTTPGVETNDIKTPYRFRIAIGKMFDASDVLKRLEDRLVAHTNNIRDTDTNAPIAKISKIHDILATQHKFYALVLISNDNKVFDGETKEEVEKKVQECLKDNPTAKVEYSWMLSKKN